VNQDIPSNFRWKDLYDASPNAKVILTVRASEEEWQKSWIGFMEQEMGRQGNPAFWILNKFIDYKFMGHKFYMMTNIGR